MQTELSTLVTVFSAKGDGELYLTKNFQVKEFKCGDGTDPIFMNILLPVICQAVRNWFGYPFIPTSAYRTIPYNKECGGVENSLHCYGNAVDIPIRGAVTVEQLYQFLDKLLGESCELGMYDWGCHVGIQNAKERFDSRKKV